MSYDVFISHAAEDKHIADAICSALESARVRSWIAPRDIVPGKDWAEAIIDAIAACKIMVFVYSQHANESPQILREVERAVNGGLIIIPFRLAETPFTKQLEYFVSTCHWLDAVTPPVENHISHLVETVGLLLSRVEHSASHLDIDTPPSTADEIRSTDPNDLAFKEVELRLSDTWDAFRAWLATEVGDAEIQSIREDPDSAAPDFGCSGTPGSLSYRIAISTVRRGIRATHKLDVVHDWLYPLALSMEPTRSYVPWDTSLFVPNGDSESISIADPVSQCRDCDFWVLFTKKR